MLGVDTGGTFTDFVYVKDGDVLLHKCPSTPNDPSKAIAQGILALAVEKTSMVVHGTTVATNAILERKGAKTALLTHNGLEHLLLIGRQERPDIYALHPTVPTALIPQELCFGVRGRRNKKGQLLEALDETEIRQVAQRLKKENVASLVIGFLHAYACTEDEERAKAIVHDIFPELNISLSSEVLPVFREVERLMTTAMNAYIAPQVSSYIQKLSERLQDRPLFLMQSNGGTLLPSQAQAQPVRLALSGPAGGVVAAFELAQRVLETQNPQIMTLDMGGTSTDVALCPGRLPYAQNHEMNGLPLALPVIDIHTVGAGGGSLVRIDAGGALKVGPKSAGALPGPICYGKGGKQLTVTDANLFLGRLQQDRALGTDGGIQPSIKQVQSEVESLADNLSTTPEVLAQGVIDVVDEHMVHALSKVSVQCGYDPQDFVLIPFGGAGPLHMCSLADKLKIKKIIVPPLPGVLSAMGLILADRMLDQTQSLLLQSDAPHTMDKVSEAVSSLKEKLQVHFPVQEQSLVKYHWRLAMRYPGQSHELWVPYEQGKDLTKSIDLFHRRHEEVNGWQKENAPQLIALRASAYIPNPHFPPPHCGTGSAFDVTETKIYEEKWIQSTKCSRQKIAQETKGPLLVIQSDATLWIASGWRGTVHDTGALILLKEKEG